MNSVWQLNGEGEAKCIHLVAICTLTTRWGRGGASHTVSKHMAHVVDIKVHMCPCCCHFHFHLQCISHIPALRTLTELWWRRAGNQCNLFQLSPRSIFFLPDRWASVSPALYVALIRSRGFPWHQHLHGDAIRLTSAPRQTKMKNDSALFSKSEELRFVIAVSLVAVIITCEWNRVETDRHWDALIAHDYYTQQDNDKWQRQRGHDEWLMPLS